MVASWEFLLWPGNVIEGRLYAKCQPARLGFGLLLSGGVSADGEKVAKNKQEAHVPATNVLWMQYLVDICTTEKNGPVARMRMNTVR